MIALKPCKGKLLIAEPSLIGDLSFNRSVVLLASHDHKGTIGFVLNKSLHFLLQELIPEINSPCQVYSGGPIDQDNLYFIHTVPHLIKNSVEITPEIFWGGDFEETVKLLNQNEISENEIRFFLGYSGWDPQQLQEEVDEHSWIVVENDLKNKLLHKSKSDLWRQKLVQLGGDYLLWSNAPENPMFN